MTAALDDGRRAWGAAQWDATVDDAVRLLERIGTRTMATLLDNGPAFVALDEAALKLRVVHVPLPLFFTPAQWQHALKASGADTLLVEPALASHWPGIEWSALRAGERDLAVARLPGRGVTLPSGTAKITFTSGSTGSPKGVCLTAASMHAVARGLVAATAALGISRHLNVLPYAVLLENIAGLMAPRLHGATVLSRPLGVLGLEGATTFDALRFDGAVRTLEPDSLILLPQMLRAWVGLLKRSGLRAPPSLKLVAVGGAAVGAPLVRAAHAVGIPACEGYGLSEGASVQTLNLPGAECAGSVGRPLPHARLRIAADGEIEIAGSLFSGYLGDPAPVPAWWPTGDLGHIDGDGFVHVRGRKASLIVTAFGRNVSPEWVEAALRDLAAVAQAVVFGDGQPALSAVLWPARADADDASLQAAVDAANATLPDYARVAAWVRGCAPFDASGAFATPNGRPQRGAIRNAHAAALGLDLTLTA